MGCAASKGGTGDTATSGPGSPGAGSASSGGFLGGGAKAAPTPKGDMKAVIKKVSRGSSNVAPRHTVMAQHPVVQFLSPNLSFLFPSLQVNAGGKSGGYSFYRIEDRFKSLEEVSDGLREAGLESSQLIIAIDYTKSNQWSGKKTYGGRPLHFLDPDNLEKNPYMQVIEVVGRVMAPFDEDNLIPVFGFGDTTTTDRSVFPFFPDRPARGFQEVLARYKELTPRVVMSGPTNFAPAIEAAVQIVQETKAYHILLIIADGQVTNRTHTEAAIIRASDYALSIVLVGVGDGPWDAMEEFDDSLPQRKFDNFQVSFPDKGGRGLIAKVRFQHANLRSSPLVPLSSLVFFFSCSCCCCCCFCCSSSTTPRSLPSTHRTRRSPLQRPR